METTDLAAQIRTEHKKGPARRLRRQGLVPAVFYGRNTDNIHLTVKSSDVLRLQKDKKDTAFIKLIIDDGGKKIEKLSFIKELQVQPVTRNLYHADFYEVDMSRPQVFDVELILAGKAVGVDNGGILQHIKRHMKVSCLPKDLPNSIEVEVTSLDIGQAVKLVDITLPAGLTLLDHPEDAVASVIAVRAAVAAAEGEGAESAAAEAAEPAKEEKKEKAE
jgi:large subunit ribosomal protein L25